MMAQALAEHNGWTQRVATKRHPSPALARRARFQFGLEFGNSAFPCVISPSLLYVSFRSALHSLAVWRSMLLSAGVGMTYFLVREGREAWEGVDTCHGCADEDRLKEEICKSSSQPYIRLL